MKGRVLDLFAGLQGWSEPWRENGWEVITLDYEESFGSDLTMDIRDFAVDPLYILGERPDVILASPPCEAFSVMTIGRNWTVGHTPKTEKAELAVELVQATLDVITTLKPRFWVMENPRAKLRKLPVVDGLDRVTVTYCQYGEPFMKPTDLWGGFPRSWWPKPVCKPRAPCHVSAARGSTTGIQGKGEQRWTHPVLLAQSNNGHREDERARRTAGQEALLEKVAAMAARPSTSRTKFKGGMIEVMSRFPSWSDERKMLSALRAKIPYELSNELRLAVEADMQEDVDVRQTTQGPR